MAISKCTSISVVALTFLVGVGIFCAYVYPNLKPSSVPLIGPGAFVEKCSPKNTQHPECQSPEAIQKAFGFDLMTEVNGQYQKMKKTADDIAKGRLTDDAYESCLKAGTCAAVPMLDEGANPNTPQAKAISKTFWQIADGHKISADVCAFMPVCATALQNGALVLTKHKSIVARVSKP